MNFLPGFLSLTGINYTFWVGIGLLRYITERLRTDAQRHFSKVRRQSTTWDRTLLYRLSIEFVLCLGLLLTSIVIVSVSLDHDLNLRTIPLTARESFGILLIVSWALWPLIAAFMVRRLDNDWEQLSSIGVAAAYWIYSLIVAELFLGISLSLTSVEAFVALLLVMGSGLLGASLANLEYRRGMRLHMVETTAAPSPHRPQPHEVAVIIAAHNEEPVIARTLEAITKIVPPDHIFIGNDASTDHTSTIARSFGCQVADLYPNRGKAKVLRFLLDHFQICDRFKAVLILDADIVVYPDFLDRILPHFDDPRVVATPGRSIPRWHHHLLPKQAMFITAYRIRLWRMLQFGLRYGQTWRYTNMSTIIPGAMSVYRSSVLRELKIDAPGLVIEDFNMTFEVHHRRLGRIAYDARALVDSQQPLTIGDYVRQIRRWYLGWWQTVWRHGFWPSAFWFFMAAFTWEMIVNAIFVLLVPVMVFVLTANNFSPVPFPVFRGFTISETSISLTGIIIAVFVVDYLSTLLITIIERKPMLLFYGLGFFPMRFLDALMFLMTIPQSFFTKSDGRWVHPMRNENVHPESPSTRHMPLSSPPSRQTNILPT